MIGEPQQIGLFEQAPRAAVKAEEAAPLGMVRAGDPATSRAAAAGVARGLTELHEKVMAAFGEHGAMTDEQLETLPGFTQYGPSTIRKRRSELFQMGRLVADGEAVNLRGKRMNLWRVKA